MFSQQLTQSGHTRQFMIADAGTAGWEVREERDSRVVRCAWYTDWHRVERRRLEFARRIAELERNGWRRV